MPILVNVAYGKSGLRLTRVRRDSDTHSFSDLSLDISLEGGFHESFTQGDNHGLIATDSMKNAALILAQRHHCENIESYARELAAHFIEKYEHVTLARVAVVETPWLRATVRGSPHSHSFLSVGTERWTTTVVHDRRSGVSVESGLAGLAVLKTTGSEFAGFIQDEYTTLKDTDDRILSTVVEAVWTCTSIDFDAVSSRNTIRTALLETFASHHSRSLQQTVYEMGRAALAACEAIEEIRLTMPNKHQVLADLSPFGIDNLGEVFVPVDKPYGMVSGTLRRK